MYCILELLLHAIIDALEICHKLARDREYLKDGFIIYFQYEDGDEVVLWMSTVGPYHNRQETYSYYSLPFCTGTKNVINHYHETLAEALQGIELKFSGLEIEFKGMHI